MGQQGRKSRAAGAVMTKGMLVVEGAHEKGLEKCVVVGIGLLEMRLEK